MTEKYAAENSCWRSHISGTEKVVRFCGNDGKTMFGQNESKTKLEKSDFSLSGSAYCDALN
jgi:hypothetical protein